MAENTTQNKPVKGKRKWVIRAMAIFLVALALLTFFSNTIMNATIPKVMGAYAQRGNLASTNSATGTVQADTKHEVKGIDGRIVEDVLVSNYEYVTAGQAICTLEPVTDTTQLDELNQQLTELEREAEYAERDPGNYTDYSSLQASVDQAQQALNDANAMLSLASNRDSLIATAQSTINSLNSSIPGLEATLTSETDTVSDINFQISELQITRASIQSQIDTLVTIGVPMPTPMPEDYVWVYDPAAPTPTPAPAQSTERIGQLQEEIMAIDAQLDILNQELTEAQARVTAASTSLANAQSALATAEADLEAAQALPTVEAAQAEVNLASSSLTSAQRTYSDTLISAGIAADRAQDAIDDRNLQIEQLQTQIAELEEALNKTEIVAPADGIVYSLIIGKGDTLSKDTVIFQVIPEDSTYSVSFTFSASVAQSLQIGTDLDTDLYYIDHCTIVSIRPDETNPRDSRIVKCSLSADWLWPGETITVTASRSNQTYDAVIVSSAVNEDNSGTFVYVIVKTSSPLGDKYVVRRVSVTVQDTSGAFCAISAEGIEGNMIVTRSERPLHDGDRVRMEDYSSDSQS